MSNLIDSGNSTISGTVTIGDGSSLVGITEDAVIESGGELSLDITALTNLKAVDATEKTIVVEPGGKIRTGTTGTYYTIPADGSYKLRSEEIGDALTYDGNSGTVNSETSISVVYASPAGAKTVDPLMVAARDGYVFQDWNTAANGTGTAYDPSDPITPAVGANTVLYAQWALAGPVENVISTLAATSTGWKLAQSTTPIYQGIQATATNKPGQMTGTITAYDGGLKEVKLNMRTNGGGSPTGNVYLEVVSGQVSSDEEGIIATSAAVDVSTVTTSTSGAAVTFTFTTPVGLTSELDDPYHLRLKTSGISGGDVIL
jgi:uncharacterized repeat protein (TIGR02543 family)